MLTGSLTENGSPQPVLPLFRECIALFTGYWPEGFRPRWKRRPWWHLVTTVLSLLGSVAGSSFILTMSLTFWPFLLLSWMLTVHGARKAYLVICHYAVHGNMTGNTWWDRVLVEVLSTLLTTSHFARYHQDHRRTHHGLQFATLEDPDLQFLLALGFRPGISRDALWRQLYWTLVSPRFHLLFLWFRLQVNFIAAPWYHRIMASVYATAIVTFLVLTDAWFPWLMAWVVPLFPLYHVAALLQFVSEHRWLQVSPTDNQALSIGEGR
jgi:Fatty acid desaturase